MFGVTRPSLCVIHPYDGGMVMAVANGPLEYSSITGYAGLPDFDCQRHHP